MREEFETCLELASATMTVEDLAASADFSLAQKGIIFQNILSQQAQTTDAPLPDSLATAQTVDPPAAQVQEMLAPLAAASADPQQLIKNRESARAFEKDNLAAPVLRSAMERAARALSTSGSLPSNSTALPHGSAPPPPFPHHPFLQSDT
jgi:hypothetical protein